MKRISHQNRSLSPEATPKATRSPARGVTTAMSLLLACLTAGGTEPAKPIVQQGEMAGYLLVPHEKVPPTYNAGFSLYAAAWPILDKYPGHRFQTGLFGTWMFAQNDPKPPGKMYSDIEGGLGWWRDTHFPTETPKFIMGGVGPNFSEIANAPGYGAGTWEKPRGLYGVAQLSPWLLFPLDGLNLKQGTRGQLFGYGYLPLPLAVAKPTTAGANVPTGDQCWTLFLNSGNFKGPVAFFLPYFWSHFTIKSPEWAGLLLDARPSEPNRAVQMETQYVPAVQSVDGKGETYARIAPTAFPAQPDGTSLLLHRLATYNKDALWNDVKRWFEGGAPATGAVNPAASANYTFGDNGGATWRIYTPETPKENRAPLAWKSFATPFAPDPLSYGYRWDLGSVKLTETPNVPLITLPEYFHLNTTGKNPEWQVVSAKEVPVETGLTQHRFEQPQEKPQEPRVTPDDLTSSWKTPGPAAGPFKARLGDGSTVTYYWYRFADQPALLNGDLTKVEREQMQTRVEKLHRAWGKDRDYLPPPMVGQLADLDPAQIVTPPKGLEIGYVPIATRQELEEKAAATMPAAPLPAPKKTAAWDNNPRGVQVFILAGQSNMVGHGKANEGHGDVKGAIGSLRYQVEHDPKNYGHLVNPDGSWKTRDDVKVWWRDSDVTAPRSVIKGDLKFGYAQGRNPTWFGPEYGFGWAIGDRIEEPVLIIKVAWGGKSLNVDFRAPGAVKARGGVVGPYYTGLLTYVRDALDNLGTEFSEWKGMGYHIAGIGWHQGWNDRVDKAGSANYEANLVDLINDLRAEFGNPRLPVSITTTGMAPPPELTPVEQAQLAVADPNKYPAFKGNVKTTDTRPFWRDASVSPSGLGYHWNHNGESEYLNGKAMGDQMAEMLGR